MGHTPNIDATVRALERTLAGLGTPSRAVQSARYLKSELRFLGTTVPIVRREAKSFARSHRELDGPTLRALVAALWATDTHELRSLAIGILEQRPDLLRTRDTTWLIDLVRHADTWAHVDWLAIKVLGPLVTGDAAAHRKIDAWSKDENLWVRRTALLAWHDPLIRGEGDFDHFARLAVPMLHETEFFIRKAIGWVLRSTARKQPQKTIAFVLAHAADLSALSFKEATRNLPPVQQKTLLALRRRELARK